LQTQTNTRGRKGEKFNTRLRETEMTYKGEENDRQLR